MTGAGGIPGRGDVSLMAGNDSSSPAGGDACAWCGEPAPDPRAKFCAKRCRQSAWRLRQRSNVSAAPGVAGPLRFAYADPPYPGLSKKYYGDQESYAGEVDHGALIASLRARHDAGELAGWALSTAGRSLRDLLPLCPEGTHVAVWVKDLEVPPGTYGPHYRWEAVLVVGGRRMRPGVLDWICARPARLGGSDLPGRKPIAFWAWLFDLLGMCPGDAFEDMFPGTGTGARAWAYLSRAAAADASRDRVATKASRDPEATGGVARTSCDASVVDARRVLLSRLQPRRVALDVSDDTSSPPGHDDMQRNLVEGRRD